MSAKLIALAAEIVDTNPAGSQLIVNLTKAETGADIIEALDRSMFIPIIAPIGVSTKGETYNINADLVASRLAIALGADKLILLTDVPGILDGDGELISSIPIRKVKALLANGTVSGGMIPKVRCCVEAVGQGVRKSHIIDGRVPHSVLLEVFTDGGVGTEIYLET